MRKIFSCILMFGVVMMFSNTALHASEFVNDGENSGSGGVEIDSSTTRKIVDLDGEEKHDGYWWYYSSTWNNVYSSYDNDKSHSATACADGSCSKTETDEKEIRVHAMQFDAGGIQFMQEVYYNYW